jgi:hypothetical protein
MAVLFYTDYKILASTDGFFKYCANDIWNCGCAIGDSCDCATDPSNGPNFTMPNPSDLATLAYISNGVAIPYTSQDSNTQVSSQSTTHSTSQSTSHTSIDTTASTNTQGSIGTSSKSTSNTSSGTTVLPGSQTALPNSSAFSLPTKHTEAAKIAVAVTVPVVLILTFSLFAICLFLRHRRRMRDTAREKIQNRGGSSMSPRNGSTPEADSRQIYESDMANKTQELEQSIPSGRHHAVPVMAGVYKRFAELNSGSLRRPELPASPVLVNRLENDPANGPVFYPANDQFDHPRISPDQSGLGHQASSPINPETTNLINQSTLASSPPAESISKLREKHARVLAEQERLLKLQELEEQARAIEQQIQEQERLGRETASS